MIRGVSLAVILIFQLLATSRAEERPNIICLSNRCIALTGLYEYRHGCNFDDGNLVRWFVENSYSVLLREAGYFTDFAGKIGFTLQGEQFEAFEAIFDSWAGGPGQTHYDTAKNKGIAQYADLYPHCSRAYGAWGVDFIQAAKASGKPFCMSISFKAPHTPQTPDPIDLALYEGKHLSPQENTSRAAKSYRESVKDYDDSARKYYAVITGVDAVIGMIRDALERDGMDDNTMIVFTSDNGYNSGLHEFGDKVIPYEERSKSPLRMLDPRQSNHDYEPFGKLFDRSTSWDQKLILGKGAGDGDDEKPAKRKNRKTKADAPSASESSQ